MYLYNTVQYSHVAYCILQSYNLLSMILALHISTVLAWSGPRCEIKQNKHYLGFKQQNDLVRFSKRRDLG